MTTENIQKINTLTTDYINQNEFLRHLQSVDGVQIVRVIIETVDSKSIELKRRTMPESKDLLQLLTRQTENTISRIQKELQRLSIND